MDSRLLEYFLRVAELGSINKAAGDMHLSQPALSRHIAALEHEMGSKLFTRTRGGVRITDAGRLLSDRARPLLRQFAILKEQVGEKASGQLTIGIPPSWRGIFTLRLVARLVDEYPGLALRVYEGVSNLLREYLYAGLLDLCIVPFESSPPSGYLQNPLVREPLVLVGHAHAGLRPSEPVPVSRLDGLQLILPGRQNFMRLQVEHHLARKGLTFNLAVETDALSLCLELACQGTGFTVVPACAVSERAGQGVFSWTPIRGMFITWVLCENEARTHSQAVREGRRLVMSTMARSLHKEIWFGAEDLKAKPSRDARPLASA